ncbi:HemK2/MTQ2 family protein methyltransferase [Planctomycetota bacterium]
MATHRSTGFGWFDIPPNTAAQSWCGVFNLRDSFTTDADIPIHIEVADPEDVLFVTNFGLTLFFAGDPQFTEDERNGRVCDIGFGCGAYPVVFSKLGFQHIDAVDINPRAPTVARANLRVNRCDMSKVHLFDGNLFEPLEGRYDLIVTNTSHLPEVEGVPVCKGIDFALLGGRNGRRMLDGVIESFGEYLAPGGRLLIVHSSLCGKSKTVRRLRDLGFSARQLYSHRMPIPFLAYKGKRRKRIGAALEELKEANQAVYTCGGEMDVEVLEVRRSTV